MIEIINVKCIQRDCTNAIKVITPLLIAFMDVLSMISMRFRFPIQLSPRDGMSIKRGCKSKCASHEWL